MDAFNKTIEQFQNLYRQMTPSQRGTLIVVPVMIVVALGLLAFRDGTSSYEALYWGKTFTTQELMTAEQALNDAGLTYEREGQRLLVPRGEMQKYIAILGETGSMPDDWASELEKSLESASPFSSREQLQARKEIVLGKELRRIIRAIDGIDDASVTWARSKPGRWPNTGSKVTALVTVRPRSNRELSTQMVHSLRTMTAHAVPDLSVADVTVLDQSTGVAHSPEPDDSPFDSRFTQKMKEYTREYKDRIAGALSYIPDVLVTVNVDLENLKRSTERSRTIDPKVVNLITSESTQKHTSNEQPPQSEVGTGPNRPASVQTANSVRRSQTTDETSAERVNVASVTWTERDLIAAMPKAVQVAVQIPDEYYRAVVVKQGTPPGTTDEEKSAFASKVAAAKSEVELRVKNTVMQAIPSGSPPEAVNITTYVPVPREIEIPTASFVEMLTDLSTRWGGTTALALFALAALWMLYRSAPSLPAPAAAAAVSGRPALAARADEEEDEAQEPEPTPRDQLQIMVRNNPELAAAVLSKWIQTAK